tara:strand:- start:245 stop:562 length:318 start_codon:yes stop_codon:yes gene_type:complete
MKVEIKRSDKKNKKLVAIFYDDNNKKLKTTHFGSKPNKDFTIYSKELNKKEANEKKDAYIARHKVREDFNKFQTAGSLSRWVLWNKPTLASSILDYRKRFKLKKF